MLSWQVVKFCCIQICSRMSLSLLPLESPVFPGSRIGISVPQMCKNQQFSSWHGRLSSAVPLGQWQGLASILHLILCRLLTSVHNVPWPDPFTEPPLPSALPFCTSCNPRFHLHPPLFWHWHPQAPHTARFPSLCFNSLWFCQDH